MDLSEDMEGVDIDAPDFTILPEGDVKVQIADAELLEPHVEYGQKLSIKFVILDGARKGEAVTWSTTWKGGDKPDKVAKSRKAVGRMARACGLADGQCDIGKMLNIPFVITTRYFVWEFEGNSGTTVYINAAKSLKQNEQKAAKQADEAGVAGDDIPF